MKSLQNKLNLIKEGKGNKELFLKEARAMFPNVVTGALTFDQAVHNLTERGILSEGFIGLSSQTSTQPNWFEIFNENVKADLKKPDTEVEKMETRGYDYKDEKNSNNLSMESILSGYYAELKDPKNAEKTEEELKEMVTKNLTKDPLHYMKDGAFGVKGIGYTDQAPGLGATKEVAGKYKSSGMEPVKLNEVFYGSSDGDFDENQKDIQMAEYYYDKGLEAYGEGDFLKADRYYTAALRYGSYVGWTEADLPPYGDDMNEALTEGKNKAMEKAVKEIEKKSELAKAEAKIQEIEALISELESKLTMTEADGVSEMVDKKKVKEIQSNIKFLEARKKKYHKEKSRMESKVGGKKKMLDEKEAVDYNTEDDLMHAQAHRGLKRSVSQPVKPWSEIVKGILASKGLKK